MNVNTFPHMANENYPLNDGNVYLYENNFDYKKWVPNTKIKLLNIKWDSQYSNVAGFESNELREKWFKAQNGNETMLTIASELMPDGSVKLPLTFEEVSQYNYMQVIFPEVKSSKAQRRFWYFFIEDFESLSQNTTKLYLNLDIWTCFINEVKISGLILERGHFPVAKTNVETYLKNPYENNDLLLEPDVIISEARNVSNVSSFVINDKNMYACFCLTSNPQADWGSKNNNDWVTPCAQNNITQGVNTTYVLAIKADVLPTFLANVDFYIANFKNTVLAVFFAPEKLLSFSASFTFCDTTCYRVEATQKSFNLITLNKEMFGYDSKIADLAKLYTSPYAKIEIADENGFITDVKIEDCNGSIDLNVCLNLAFPSLSIDRFLTDVNGANNSLTFANVTERNFKFGGDWYKTISSWNIQTFAVFESGYNVTDFSTFYNREQSEIALTNAYESAVESANTAQTNANESANTAQTNANESANTAQTNANASADNALSNVYALSSASFANNATQITANSAIASTSNSGSATDTSLGNALNQALQAWDAGYSRSTTQAENEAQTQSASVALAGTVLSTIGAIANNPAGAVSTIANGVVQGATTAASTAITTNLSSTKTEAGISNSQSKTSATSTNNIDRNNNQISVNTSNVQTQNSAMTAITSQNASTANSNASASNTTARNNASRTRNTSINNASRTRNTSINNASRSKDTAVNAISNSFAQGGLNAPSIFGTMGNGTVPTRPIAMFANIITLPKGALAKIGTEFKRYGYNLNQYIEFETFNVMKNFSYWKAKELWLTSSKGVNANSQNIIKNIIMSGVTVWKNPEKIGEVNFYDN